MPKTIQIEVSKIKSNPFKKFINNGKLNPEVIAKLVEGYKQTTFHENLSARYNDKGEVELIYGHHRLEACKKVYGDKKVISIRIFDKGEFSDEKMLVDMIRENLTHRGEDYNDMSQSIILAERWLGDEKFRTRFRTSVQQGKRTDLGEDYVSNEKIAKFLSFGGKSLSIVQIGKYRHIHGNLSPALKSKIMIGERSGKIKEDMMGFEVAGAIATIPKNEQNKIAKKVVSESLSKDDTKKAISAYKLASEDVKDKVKEGSLKLSDVSMENLKEQIKEVKVQKQEKNKDKDKNKIIAIEYGKLLKKAQVLVGEANQKIIRALAMLKGLERTGILQELEWKKVNSILRIASDNGKQYYEMAEELRGLI